MEMTKNSEKGQCPVRLSCYKYTGIQCKYLRFVLFCKSDAVPFVRCLFSDVSLRDGSGNFLQFGKNCNFLI